MTVHTGPTTLPVWDRCLTWGEAIARANRVNGDRPRVFKDSGGKWCVHYRAALVAINGSAA